MGAYIFLLVGYLIGYKIDRRYEAKSMFYTNVKFVGAIVGILVFFIISIFMNMDSSIEQYELIAFDNGEYYTSTASDEISFNVNKNGFTVLSTVALELCTKEILRNEETSPYVECTYYGDKGIKTCFFGVLPRSEYKLYLPK